MYIPGRGGNETLVGGADNDSIDGFAGNDLIQGGGGVDWIWGGDGNDTLQGGERDDQLDGGAGNDWIESGEGDGDDTAFGGPGDDTLLGGSLSNDFLGGAGNDTLSGAAGRDLLDGGDGNDFLDGGSGGDFLEGGPGDDTLDGGADAGEGFDEDYADYWADSGSVVVNLALGIAYDGDGGTDTLIEIERVWASSHDDTIVGDGNANTLFAVDGNDALDGAGGDDRIHGGNGNDTLVGGAGNDFLHGGAGNDFLDGGSGHDIAYFSGNQADYSFETIGDLLYLEGPDGRDGLLDVEELQFSGVTTVVGHDGTPGDDFLMGDEDGGIIDGQAGDDIIFGGAGNDRLEGGLGDDLLNGGGGDDVLVGGGGNDRYVVDDLSDELVELEEAGDNDKVFASLDYTIGDFIEDLKLTQGVGAALAAIGNAQDNVITGNEFDNQLTGAAGDDSLDGGIGGLDTAHYSGPRSQYGIASGAIWTIDGSAAGEGVDTLSNVERLQFADGKFALDVHGTGHAGLTAKVLWCVAGIGSVTNASNVGICLDLLDNAMTYEQLMDAALDLMFGPNPTNSQFVTRLYTNLAGVVPDTATLNQFVGLIDNGTYTQLSLAMAAAEYVGVPTVAQGGLEYR